MKRTKPIKGFISLTLQFTHNKEENVWEGHCVELGVATFGDELEATQQELRELVLLHLNGLEEMGVRDKVFAENGIEFHDAEPVERKVTLPADERTYSQNLSVSIPLPLACNQ